MKLVTHTRVHGHSSEWKNEIRKNLKKYKHCFNDSLDLRVSGDFVKSEVLLCNHKIYVYDDTSNIVGFAYLNLQPRYMFINVICSFRKNVGSYIMNHIETKKEYDKEFVLLRSTLHAVGFYVKRGYMLFNYNDIYTNVSGHTNVAFNVALRSACNSVGTEKDEACHKLYKLLVKCKWSPTSDENGVEFPLCLRRYKLHTRTSPRIANIDVSQIDDD